MSSTPNALLGKGSDFEGKLTFEGTVHIDGRFTGEIFSEGTLIIGEGAEVQAEIRVGSVAVYGNVTGNITAADAVELHAPASLRGNITSPALHIDKGVFFDGSCQMTSKQSAQGQRPPALPANRPTAAPALQPQSLQAQAMQGQGMQGQGMQGQGMQGQPLRESQPMPPPPAPAQRNSGIFLPEPSLQRPTGELPHKF